MQIGILVAEMIVIFLLILMGYAGYRSGRISDSGVKTCSYLVVNLCNPALLLSNAIAEEAPVPAPKMRAAIYAAVLVYVILIPLSYLISRLIRAPEKDDYAYRMMTIYGNVGFIGIPVCSAVLGSASLLYISINCMVFNVTFYTYGMASMRRAARLQTGEARKPVKASEILKDIINVGTVSSLLSVLIYMLDPKVPMILADSHGFPFDDRAGGVARAVGSAGNDSRRSQDVFVFTVSYAAHSGHLCDSFLLIHQGSGISRNDRDPCLASGSESAADVCEGT